MKKDKSIYSQANWCQRLFFLYINPLIALSNKRYKEGGTLTGTNIYIYIYIYTYRE